MPQRNVVTTARRPAWASLLLLSALAGCASAPAPAPAPTPAAAPTDAALADAVQRMAADLASQLGAGAARSVVVDPMIDKATGQQTELSQRVQGVLVPALTTALKDATILPFDATNEAKARFVLTGTVSLATAPDGYLVNIALTDRPSGLVVAQSAGRFKGAGGSVAPTRFYNDSPSLVRDRSVDGYVRTAETRKGDAADALYVSQLPTAAILADALEAYNAGRWEVALAAYNTAAARADGQQLRTFNGIYLANVRLGKLADAETAFGRIAALGLATNNLSVKLLFRPNSATEFWPGRDLAGMYPMWLRQIARAMQANGACLDVVGHTSKSGTEAVNERLSRARAETVRRLLVAERAALASRLQATGMGFRETIIGTGSDDAADALDRRVEFKVATCPG